MAARLGLEIYEWVNRFARKLAAKPNAQGIMQIPNQEVIRDLSNEILTKFMKYNVPRDALKSENDIKVIYNQIIGMEDQQLRRNVISPGDPRYQEITERIFGKKPGDVVDMTGKKIDTSKPILGGKNVDEVDMVADTVTRIISMEPVAAMKEANLVIGRKGVYKNLTKEQSQKILKDSEDWIFQRDPDDLYDYNKKRPFRDDADPEDLAHGGRTGTGLNYLLGEDDQNVRVPFKDGTKFDPKRRGFLKVAAGLASIPLIGKYFKWAKPLAKSSKVLTQVPIKDISGMPVWFKPLVNKVIKEGDDVTKKYASVDREIVHKSTLPDSKTDVLVTQDLTTGNVTVDIGMGKHGFGDGHLGQPVTLNYKASEVIEPIKGKKGTTTKEEFWVEEAEFTGGHPENVKFEESTFEKFGEHGSDFTEVEKFATGKVKKAKPLKKRKATEWNEGSAQAEADAAAERGHWIDDRVPEADDFASGGRVPLNEGGISDSRVGMLFGGGIFKTIIKNLAKAKGVNPSEYLKVTNYKTLPREVRNLMSEADFNKMKAGRIEMFENWVDMAKTRKEFLKNIEQGKKTPAAPVFEHLEKSFKSPVPSGVTDKDILQGEFILKNLKTKGRKLNASGGLAGMLGE